MSKVGDSVVSGRRVPSLRPGTSALEAVGIIDEMNVGFVIVTDNDRYLRGIITDGDIRRFVRMGVNLSEKTVDELMTRSPKTTSSDRSIADTIETMQKDEITTLVVIDDSGRIEGYIHLHDILGRGGTIKISVPV
jgi:arabinose-5-phosphate isomerase